MTLIEHEARVGLPRMWEHPKRTRTRRGGVATSMVGGYTAILLVRQPNGVENSIRRQCSTLNEAEKWLNERPRETGCARTVAGCERENGRGLRQRPQ